MGAPTFGQQSAAIVGFIAMCMLLGPVMSLVAPQTFTQNYFGSNGIINQTYSSYRNTFVIPILQTANSTTGFGAAGSLTNSAFSALAFIYGGLGLFWKSLTNTPQILWLIFSNMTTDIVFLPAAMGSIFIIICFTYVIIGDFWKVLSMWQKSDAENVGN